MTRLACAPPALQPSQAGSALASFVRENNEDVERQTQTVVQRWPKWKHAYLAEAHGRCPLAVQIIGQRVNRKLYWCVPSEFGHHTDMCADRNMEDNRQSQTQAPVWFWEHTCLFLNQGSKKSLKFPDVKGGKLKVFLKKDINRRESSKEFDFRLSYGT